MAAWESGGYFDGRSVEVVIVKWILENIPYAAACPDEKHLIDWVVRHVLGVVHHPGSVIVDVVEWGRYRTDCIIMCSLINGVVEAACVSGERGRRGLASWPCETTDSEGVSGCSENNDRLIFCERDGIWIHVDETSHRPSR